MKVSIIGLGMVGKEVLHYFIHFGSATEIVAIDLNKDKTQAELFDFEDTYALRYFNQHAKLTLGDMSDLKDSDIIIINASKPMVSPLRSLLGKENDPLMKSIAQECDKYAPNAFVLITTNPNDNMTRSFVRHSQRKAEKVLGTGTLLDSMRFQLHLAHHYGVAASSINGFVLGEHGPNVFIPWSLVHVAGLSLRDFEKLNNIKALDFDKAFDHVINRAVIIFNARGCTDHAIGSATARIAQSLLHNEQLVLPVASLLNNYLGFSDVVMSVPSIVGKDGAKPITVKLTDSEMDGLKKSYDAIMLVEKDIASK